MDDLFVEVPASYMKDPVDAVSIGSFDLRVIKKEWLLRERVAGFRHWKYWGAGVQAISMIRAFGGDIDQAELEAALKREGTADAYELLHALAVSGREITAAELRDLWHSNYQ